MTMILLASTLLRRPDGRGDGGHRHRHHRVCQRAAGLYSGVPTRKNAEALKNMAAPTARVIRDGRQSSIPAAELVPGDLIVLERATKSPPTRGSSKA